jgi:aminoglycoside phosphotransferase (APT) family kinase protein
MILEEFKSIPGYTTWKNVEQLNKGWSGEEKYIVETNDGKYLLRVTDISQYESKKRQFELLKEVEKLNLNASKPISFGTLGENKVYTLLTWLEGEDAEVAVKKLSDKEAYLLGLKAGKALVKLHSIPVDVSNEVKWIEKYKLKLIRKYKAMNESKIEVPNKELLVDYMESHLYLLENRLQTFTHGDYHVGNMIVNNNDIGIIDFEKNKISDPYDEFKQFIWNVRCNEYFETGMINGYFDNNVPSDFWLILKVYAVEQLISFLPWCFKFGEEDVKKGYKLNEEMMKAYDNLKLDIPTWYKGILKFE